MIISFIKKEKISLIILLAILVIFIVSRLVNLSMLPIFTDEAIYAYWSKVALTDPQNRFISLVDGKQPLFIWLAAFIQLKIEDPLISIRLVSVISGLFSLFGIFFLSKEIFNKNIGIIASLLYTILPFTLLYDRLGLYDSLLTAIGIYIIYLSVKLAKNPRLDLSLLTGFTLGLGQITKSSSNFFLYLLPFSLLFFPWDKSQRLATLLKWIPFALLSFFISFVMYNSLRVSPLFYIISRKNLEFIRPLSEVLKNPFLFAFSNFQALIGWGISYTGILLSIVFLFSIGYGVLKKDKRIIYLLIAIMMPLAVETIFNKIIYPRFLLFFYPYVIILSSFAIYKLAQVKKNKYLIFLITTIVLLQPLITSYHLVTNPLKASLPDADAFQLRDGWPAGYGVKEVAAFLKQESKSNFIYVGTEGTFGLYPYALNINFFDNHNIQINSYWPVNTNSLPVDILEKAKTNKTFFVFNENQKEINNPNLQFIAKYKKGNGDSYMRLYEVIPSRFK